jgi:hypothetical protein
MWKCADRELERQIRYFPYGERSNVPQLQQVEHKAVGWQRNLGLDVWIQNAWKFFRLLTPFPFFNGVWISFVYYG